ncbi:MAG: alpha/beta hydrolase, partial [Solirubrobacteraceae bacterium]|nr:alpha/beta hydrolase [Solirubrobacteraceae bacterium]
MTSSARERASLRPVQFASGATHCAGDLYLPAGDPPAAGHPIVILGHGLGATRDMGLQAYAERFAAAGFAALTFDYRSFGESGGEPRQVLSIGRQHEDWRAAIAYAAALPEIDGARVGIWGSSFGGGHVLHLAAHGAPVAAVISQCPFTDGLASSLTLGVASTLKVGAAAVADLASSVLRRSPVLVAPAGPRGSAALMTAPDALPGYDALEALAAPGHESGIAARIGLQIGRYRPGASLSKITAPTLVLVCATDTVAPTKTTLRHLEKADNPAIEVRTYETGHFDIYLGEPFERAIADMLEFLQRTL